MVLGVPSSLFINQIQKKLRKETHRRKWKRHGKRYFNVPGAYALRINYRKVTFKCVPQKSLWLTNAISTLTSESDKDWNEIDSISILMTFFGDSAGNPHEYKDACTYHALFIVNWVNFAVITKVKLVQIQGLFCWNGLFSFANLFGEAYSWHYSNENRDTPNSKISWCG